MKNHPEMWFREMKRVHKKISELSHHEDLIIFYGSSSIRLWVNIKEDLAPLNVMNMGFGGSSFKWLGYYFNDLFAHIIPDTIVFYGGENDLHTGTAPADVQHDFLKLVSSAQGKFPGARMHCISLKPSPSRKILEDKIINTNRLLKLAIGEFEGGKMINVYDAMLDEQGDPRIELYMKDQLHMNKNGYQVWTGIVREFFGIGIE